MSSVVFFSPIQEEKTKKKIVFKQKIKKWHLQPLQITLCAGCSTTFTVHQKLKRGDNYEIRINMWDFGGIEKKLLILFYFFV